MCLTLVNFSSHFSKESVWVSLGVCDGVVACPGFVDVKVVVEVTCSSR